VLAVFIALGLNTNYARLSVLEVKFKSDIKGTTIAQVLSWNAQPRGPLETNRSDYPRRIRPPSMNCTVGKLKILVERNKQVEAHWH
jgi:hypothetical protein